MPILKTQSRTPPVLSRNRVTSPLAWAKILPHVKARRPLGGLTQQFKSLNGETEAQSKIEASKLLPNSFRALTASHVVYEEESLDHDGIHQFFFVRQTNSKHWQLFAHSLFFFIQCFTNLPWHAKGVREFCRTTRCSTFYGRFHLRITPCKIVIMMWKSSFITTIFKPQSFPTSQILV